MCDAVNVRDSGKGFLCFGMDVLHSSTVPLAADGKYGRQMGHLGNVVGMWDKGS